MKINIKNLKGEVFSIELESAQTIADLKEKVKNQKGYPVDSQKVIFKGKTTNNQDQIDKLGIKQTDFLVLMTQVAKPQPKAKVEQKIQAPVNQEVKKASTEPQKKQPIKPQVPQPSPETEAQIIQLMSMGFPRQQCQAALTAAFNNSERAVQYLLNGIPSASQSSAGGLNALQGITSLPQFDQIRQMIQNDPNSLPTILQQLAQTSPQLYSLIAEHPEQFQRMIMQGGDNQGEDDQQFQGQQGQGDNRIMITPEEEAAINRLAALGFSKIEAAQAYMACDKNEEMAANLLFDRLANGDIEGGFPEQGGNNDGDDDNLFN